MSQMQFGFEEGGPIEGADVGDDGINLWLLEWWKSIGQPDPRRVALAFTIVAVSRLRARGFSDDEIREHACSAARLAGPRLEGVTRQIVDLVLQEPSKVELEGSPDPTLDAAPC